MRHSSLATCRSLLDNGRALVTVPVARHDGAHHLAMGDCAAEGVRHQPTSLVALAPSAARDSGWGLTAVSESETPGLTPVIIIIIIIIIPDEFSAGNGLPQLLRGGEGRDGWRDSKHERSGRWGQVAGDGKVVAVLLLPVLLLVEGEAGGPYIHTVVFAEVEVLESPPGGRVALDV